jgi:hypothetical protein
LNKDKGDAPDFDLQVDPTVEVETWGFHKMLRFQSAHNVKQLNQCSRFFTQLWRGNSDVKVLIHDSDPRHPDAQEISGVCDYLHCILYFQLC